MNNVILGSGFVSQGYQLALGHLGYKPIVLSRAHADYTDPAVLRPILEEQKANIVINAAGYTGVTVDSCEIHKAECFKANVTLPFDVATICCDLKVPLIHISSGCIFHGAGPFIETDPPNPQSYYAECKVLAEEHMSELEMSRWDFRIRMPFAHQASPRNWITKLMAYPQILDGLNSVTWRDEFCMRSWQIAAKAAPGVYHAVQPSPVTTLAVAQLLERSGKRGLVSLLDEDAFYKNHVKRSAAVLDCSKFERAYGAKSNTAMSGITWCIENYEP